MFDAKYFGCLHADNVFTNHCDRWCIKYFAYETEYCVMMGYPPGFLWSEREDI